MTQYEDYRGGSSTKYDHFHNGSCSSDVDSGYDDHGVISIPVVRTVVRSDPRGRKTSSTSTEWIQVKKYDKDEATTTSPPSPFRTTPERDAAPVASSSSLEKDKRRSSVVKMCIDPTRRESPPSSRSRDDDDWDVSQLTKETRSDVESQRFYRCLTTTPPRGYPRSKAYPRPTLRDVSVTSQVRSKEHIVRRVPRRKLRSKSADGRLGSQNLFSPTYSKVLSPETMRKRKAIANVLKRDCILEEEYYKSPYEECNLEVIHGRFSSSENRLNAIRGFGRNPTRREVDEEEFHSRISTLPNKTSTPVASTDNLRNLIFDLTLDQGPQMNAMTRNKKSERERKTLKRHKFLDSVTAAYSDGVLSLTEDQMRSKGLPPLSPRESRTNVNPLPTHQWNRTPDCLPTQVKFATTSPSQDEFYDTKNLLNTKMIETPDDERPSNPFRNYFFSESSDDTGVRDIVYSQTKDDSGHSDDWATNSDESTDDPIYPPSGKRQSKPESDGGSKDSVLNEGGKVSSLKRSKETPSFKKTVSFSNETEELYYLSTPSESDSSVFGDDCDKPIDQDSGAESFIDDAETIVVKTYQCQQPMQAQFVHVLDLTPDSPSVPKHQHRHKRHLNKFRHVRPISNESENAIYSNGTTSSSDPLVVTQSRISGRSRSTRDSNISGSRKTRSDSTAPPRNRNGSGRADKVNIQMSNSISSAEHEILLKTYTTDRSPVVTVSRIRVPLSSIQDQWHWATMFMLQEHGRRTSFDLDRLTTSHLVRNGSLVSTESLGDFKCGSPSPSGGSSSGCFSGPSTPSPTPTRNKTSVVPTAL